MDNIYQKWIDKNVINPHLNCETATIEMKNRFPELIRVRGFYCCLIYGKRPHWWLKNSNGNIIDPTANQFATKGIMGDYEEWDESREEPTGMCPNCGEYCYNGNELCSSECFKDYLNYLNGKNDD